MSKVKQEQIEQWRFESAEIRKHLGKLQKQIEVIKARKKNCGSEIHQGKKKKY